VAGKGVHIGPDRFRVHGDGADGLGAVYKGQHAALSGEAADLLQGQYLPALPVHVREGDEARPRAHLGLDLLGRHRGRDEVHLHPEAPLQVVQRREASGVLGGGRDHLVSLPPVYRGGAEVHAVGGVLGEGEVVGVGL
jgi:hypothetical protein